MLHSIETFNFSSCINFTLYSYFAVLQELNDCFNLRALWSIISVLMKILSLHDNFPLYICVKHCVHVFLKTQLKTLKLFRSDLKYI